MIVSKGNKEGVSIRPLSNVKLEDEVLAPKGSQFKIGTIKKSKGKTIIEVEPI